MDKVKQLILQKLEDRKNDIIIKVENQIALATKTNDFVDMYELLVDVYGNTMEQANLQAELLKTNLTDDFFKNAEVKVLVNNISFSDGTYQILFPTSREKKIVIRLLKHISKPYYGKCISDVHIQLLEATKRFLSHKTIKNFKLMADINGANYRKNPIAQIVKYVNAYGKCNKKLVDNIESRIETDMQYKERYDKGIAEYMNTHKKARHFVYSLLDLQRFKDRGYRVYSTDIVGELGNKPFKQTFKIILKSYVKALTCVRTHVML